MIEIQERQLWDTLHGIRNPQGKAACLPRHHVIQLLIQLQ